jgi:hypothetical protein
MRLDTHFCEGVRLRRCNRKSACQKDAARLRSEQFKLPLISRLSFDNNAGAARIISDLGFCVSPSYSPNAGRG